MKKTFEIEIKEILVRKVSVDIEMNGQSDNAAQTQAIEEVKKMYANEEIILDSDDYLETTIKQVIAEKNSNISLDTVIEITDFVNENNFSVEDKKIIADILDIRVCSVCGNLMYDGYMIIDDYACQDNCKAQLVTDEEFEKLFLSDEAYYTEWI